jgi:hypothetical protein
VRVCGSFFSFQLSPDCRFKKQRFAVVGGNQLGLGVTAFRAA